MGEPETNDSFQTWDHKMKQKPTWARRNGKEESEKHQPEHVHETKLDICKFSDSWSQGWDKTSGGKSWGILFWFEYK